MKMTDSRALVKETMDYIDSNLKATLPIKRIAAELKSDPADIDRAFRQVTGKTIKRYIDDKCKEKLDKCLMAGTYKGYEIGTELGFSTDQAFYRWVKRVYNVSFRKLKGEKQLSSSKKRAGEAPRSTSK
jgi:AraC-like DNA-binding protein